MHRLGLCGRRWWARNSPGVLGASFRCGGSLDGGCDELREDRLRMSAWASSSVAGRAIGAAATPCFRAARGDA
jgi:hypothetical protein